MARYTPLPSVGRPRQRNLRLADLYLRQGEQQADAELRSGAIRAQLFSDLGRTVGQTATAMIEAPAKAQEQAAIEAERASRAAAQAQQLKVGALQVGAAEREIQDEENLDLAVSAHQGRRDEVLKSLASRPDLQAKIAGRYAKIDEYFDGMIKEVAGGIADADYTPEAAESALAELDGMGIDRRRTDRFRQVFQNPEAIRTTVDRILGIKPQGPVELNRDTRLVDPKTGQVIAEGPQSPAPQKSLQAKEVLLDGRPVMATFDPASGSFTVGGQDVTARVRPVPPQGPAGGEPLEAIIGADGNPTLVPRSQARGQRPATTREQPTEDERKSAGFYTQMQEAMRTLDEVEGELTEKDLYQIQTMPQEALMGMANRGQMSEAAKRYLRAFEQFTEARMRPVSGAAISDSEFARDRRTYAKQYAETPKLAEDRKAARLSALEALRSRASRALPKENKNDEGTLQVGPFTVKVKPK